MLSRTSLRSALAAAAATAALAGGRAAVAQCVDFDPPGAGAWPCCGALFASDGLGFETGPFRWTNGGVTGAGFVEIVNDCTGAGGGHSLWSNNATASFEPGQLLGAPGTNKVTFFYEDFGGSVNLEVNGLLAWQWDDFHMIPGGFHNAAGAQITTTAAWTGFSWRGTVTIEALPGECIHRVSIGGQELCLDDICVGDPCPPPCPSDIDGNGTVGIGDLLVTLGAWGPNPGHPADLDGNGVVGVGDLLMLLGDWGPC